MPFKVVGEYVFIPSGISLYRSFGAVVATPATVEKRQFRNIIGLKLILSDGFCKDDATPTPTDPVLVDCEGGGCGGWRPGERLSV